MNFDHCNLEELRGYGLPFSTQARAPKEQLQACVETKLSNFNETNPDPQ